MLERLRNNRELAQSFSKTEKEHGYFYCEEKRTTVFGVTGKRDIYQEIQSHKDENDMKFIKEVLMNDGASEELPDTMFGDVSFVANDLLTNLTNARSAREMFDSLPVDIRDKYGNDIYRFAKEFDLNNHIKKEEKKEEVKDNEKKEI